MGPLMHDVVTAMQSGIAEKVAPWDYKASQFFDDVATARGLAARIFEAPADCIAIVPSASYGIQIAANNLPLRADQHVIVLEDQFPSHVYPWQDKAAKTGARVNILPTPDDDDWTRVVLEAINAKTAIVAVPQTHWSTGVTLDLAAIRDALDDVGGALVLDLTQSLGAQPLHLADCRPDFAVAASYKWLLGPYTMGFLYCDTKWHDGAPLEHNWINRQGSEDFTGLTRYQDRFHDGAVRYDMGEKSNPVLLRGASAAMGQILDWGIKNIAETLAEKTAVIERALAPLGLHAPKAARAPHYLGLRRATGIPAGLSEALATEHIYISVRGSAMRVTPHLYTTDADIARFIAAVTRRL